MRNLIVVVEDSAAIGKFVCTVLEARGYKTLTAHSVSEAWAAISQAKSEINLVITDYHMPQESGLELLKRIKGDKSTCDIPVIFLTSEKDPLRISEATVFGAHSWVTKPYRAHVLFDHIRLAISSGKATPSHYN